MLSKKELNETVEKLKKVPQTIAVQTFTAILKNLNLYFDSVDPSAIEILDKPAREVAAIKDLDKLNEYLLAIAKMRLYLQTEVNTRDVYTTFEEGEYRKQLNILKEKRRNQIRTAKTEKAQENMLLALDKDLQARSRMIEVSKMYQKTLGSYDSILEEKGNALKRMINKRELEFQSELSKTKTY